MTTLTEKTIGQIFNDKNLKKKFISAMNEAYLLSKKFKVEFKKDPLDFWIEKIKKMPYEMTSSMFHDFKAKKKLELDWLSGLIINFGESMNMDFEINREIVNGIKVK
jgi:ketopantoate reductase